MKVKWNFPNGKRRKLHELRAIEVVNEQPLAFNITLARTYKRKTEKPNEQLAKQYAHQIRLPHQENVSNVAPRPVIFAPSCQTEKFAVTFDRERAKYNTLGTSRLTTREPHAHPGQ
ncbi:hypothetical protein BGW80DRAFT_1248162 [Lactifluus volemus]|nr:hypothetical protein BGW80DRAFT_1248162 [Lactifluus volemus]